MSDSENAKKWDALADAVKVRGLDDMTPSEREAFVESWRKQPPAVIHKQPLRKVTLHKVDFFWKGKKGDTVTLVRVFDAFLFRGESVEGADTLGGRATKIESVMIGGKPQARDIIPWTRDGEIPTTKEFVEKFNAAGKKFDTLQPPFGLYVTIVFLEDCEFKLTVFGKKA